VARAPLLPYLPHPLRSAMKSSEYRNLFYKATASKTLYETEIASKKREADHQKERLTALEEAQIFLQTVAKATQEKIRFRLEDIINLALTAVFGTRYRFEIKFEMKRGQTEASLVVYEGENELDPMEANGGGLLDILSFTLRIALLIISKNRRVLILDEPMKFVSADRRETCYALMERLSHELDIQIIAVTHEDAFTDKADRVYTVHQSVDGVSTAQLTKSK
jgi:DNA repair exonuclease SbcCD ATPase subunit